ncbi:MAG: hypothetical protein KDJ65_38895 [Anaerolineae bacterium]|nr:hypothetical protein [Anaerolineae bacterium]
MSFNQAIAIAASVVDSELSKRATYEQSEWLRDLRQVKKTLAEYLVDVQPLNAREEAIMKSNFNLDG